MIYYWRAELGYEQPASGCWAGEEWQGECGVVVDSFWDHILQWGGRVRGGEEWLPDGKGRDMPC